MTFRHFENPYVPTSQFSPEFDRLLELYEELAPRRVLEIGTEYGGTLWHWLHRAQPGTRVVNIDPGLAQATMPLDKVWQSWAPEGVSLRTIFGQSQAVDAWNAALGFLDWEIDFAFIDGDHTYEGVRRDWAMYGLSSKVTVFHDLVQHQPHFGVTKLWEDIKARHRTEEFWSAAGQKGGGIGVVFLEDPGA